MILLDINDFSTPTEMCRLIELTIKMRNLVLFKKVTQLIAFLTPAQLNVTTRMVFNTCNVDLLEIYIENKRIKLFMKNNFIAITDMCEIFFVKCAYNCVKLLCNNNVFSIESIRTCIDNKNYLIRMYKAVSCNKKISRKQQVGLFDLTHFAIWLNCELDVHEGIYNELYDVGLLWLAQHMNLSNCLKLELVKILLDGKINVNQTSYNCHPLRFNLNFNTYGRNQESENLLSTHRHILKLFINKGMDLNDALKLAVMNENIEFIPILIHHGAKVTPNLLTRTYNDDEIFIALTTSPVYYRAIQSLYTISTKRRNSISPTQAAIRISERSLLLKTLPRDIFDLILTYIYQPVDQFQNGQTVVNAITSERWPMFKQIVESNDFIPNVLVDGLTLMMYVVCEIVNTNRAKQWITLLIENGCDPTILCGASSSRGNYYVGISPLMFRPNCFVK